MDHLSDYQLDVIENDMAVIIPRAVDVVDDDPSYPLAAVSGLDANALEADWWRYWAALGRPRLCSPARAFMAYCKKRSGDD
ncbi:hypothetical protein [Qingshengfaniella alkalisoli]|uniref:hypothetical protein n=1 Tax=Qingshengfaniella alkalisoli TaxID=2599296 RepID=UPI00197C1C5B|nr:hypothetical protein [Qingshengfaniella alkalisoli]